MLRRFMLDAMPRAMIIFAATLFSLIDACRWIRYATLFSAIAADVMPDMLCRRCYADDYLRHDAAADMR